jgi:hypothetical protein
VESIDALVVIEQLCPIMAYACHLEGFGRQVQDHVVIDITHPATVARR